MMLAGSVLLSCQTAYASGEDPVLPEEPAPDVRPRDEFDGTYTLFFQPDNGNVGDPMPFYDPKSGDFKIMYLQNDIPGLVRGVFHPIWAVKTSDVAHYEFMRELIPCGPVGSQDAAIGTGSTVYNPEDGLYYNFYTGNKLNPGPTENGQVVMMATSSDYVTWHKHPDFIIKGNEYGYDRNDFRDPCVFRTDDGVWHMLVATLNLKKEGVVAEYVSDDLRNWTSAGVFMNMYADRFFECPDVFQINDWWYMIYSEKHVDVRRVMYYKGRSLDEIKKQTEDRDKMRDEEKYFLDSRGFYAGKTASDGKERYIWGWSPSRPRHDNKNVGIPPREPRWGGNLVAHKLIQHEDGSLTLGEIPAVAGRFDRKEVAAHIPVPEGGEAVFGPLEASNHLEFTVKTAGPDASFGISFCRSENEATYYTIRIIPEDGGTYNIEFAEEGPEGVGAIKWIEGCSFTPPADATYHCSVYSENSVMVLYINDNVCYTNRVYGMAGNNWSICSYRSDLEVSDVAVGHMTDNNLE